MKLSVVCVLLALAMIPLFNGLEPGWARTALVVVQLTFFGFGVYRINEGK